MVEIYKLVNKDNEKVFFYTGNRAIIQLNHNKHKNKKLQQDWNDKNLTGPIFVECCDNGNVVQQYIKENKHNCYNYTKRHLSDETRNKISESLRTGKHKKRYHHSNAVKTKISESVEYSNI